LQRSGGKPLPLQERFLTTKNGNRSKSDCPELLCAAASIDGPGGAGVEKMQMVQVHGHS
jgi:hypothetical protein